MSDTNQQRVPEKIARAIIDVSEAGGYAAFYDGPKADANGSDYWLPAHLTTEYVFDGLARREDVGAAFRDDVVTLARAYISLFEQLETLRDHLDSIAYYPKALDRDAALWMRAAARLGLDSYPAGVPNIYGAANTMNESSPASVVLTRSERHQAMLDALSACVGKTLTGFSWRGNQETGDWQNDEPCELHLHDGSRLIFTVDGWHQSGTLDVEVSDPASSGPRAGE